MSGGCRAYSCPQLPVQGINSRKNVTARKPSRVSFVPSATVKREYSPLIQPHEFSISPLKVRLHEVDQFSVVNNACFVQYLEHGRGELLQYENLLGRDEIPIYCLKSLSLQYKGPLTFGDEYIVTVETYEINKASVVLKQRVIRLDKENMEDDKVVLEGQVTVVLLNSDYRPIKMPDFFRAAAERYTQEGGLSIKHSQNGNGVPSHAC